MRTPAGTDPAASDPGTHPATDQAASDVEPDPYRPWLLQLARRICGMLLRLMFGLTVNGLENIPRSGAVLIAGNHVGSLDGPLVVMLSPRPVRALVKSEFFLGRRGALLAAIGQIPIRRGLPDRPALRRALGVLTGGGALVIFPEGECGPGTLDSVEFGVAWLALRTGAPIVPVACLGTDRAIAKGEWKPRLRTPVGLTFGQSFTIGSPPNPRSRSALAAAAEEIRLHLVGHVQAVRHVEAVAHLQAVGQRGPRAGP